MMFITGNQPVRYFPILLGATIIWAGALLRPGHRLRLVDLRAVAARPIGSAVAVAILASWWALFLTPQQLGQGISAGLGAAILLACGAWRRWRWSQPGWRTMAPASAALARATRGLITPAIALVGTAALLDGAVWAGVPAWPAAGGAALILVAAIAANLPVFLRNSAVAHAAGYLLRLRL